MPQSIKEIKYAFRELKAYSKYTVFLIISLSLGLYGLIILENLKSSLTKEVAATSRAQVGADLVVSSRLELSSQDVSKINEVLEKKNLKFSSGEARLTFSMATAGTRSKLVQVYARDPILPFYGDLSTMNRKELEEQAAVWVQPEILSQFDVELQGLISIGHKKFKITRVIDNDTASSGRGALAPKVYMSRRQFESLGLIQKGSTVTYQIFFKILCDESTLEALEKELKKIIDDPAINIDTHVHANESSARALVYLSDYLGLVSLVAFLLSLIGVNYLFRSHLLERFKDYAILRMVGWKHSSINLMILFQVFILTGFSIILTAIMAMGSLPLVAGWTQNLLPFAVDTSLEPAALLLAFGVGFLGTVLSILPVLSSMSKKTLKDLFYHLSIDTPRFWSWLPIAGFFYVMAILQSHSFKIGSLFFVMLSATVVILMGLSRYGFVMLERISRTLSFEWKFAFLEIVRRPMETMTVFLAICFGVLLPVMVVIVERTLQDEFLVESSQDQASLFLFDIQAEQVEPLKKTIEEEGYRLSSLSPLVRARLETVNGKPFVRAQKTTLTTRDQETEARSQSRSFNLSERASLDASESVSKGRYFLSPYVYQRDRLPEISLEEKFAARMKLKVGDTLGFDVLGVPVEGQVVGLRRVRWATFKPNFFIQFQEGVFNDAPKTYLASMSGLSPKQKQEIQSTLSGIFPNVSMIDVSRVIAEIIKTSNHMSLALKDMAILVLLCSAWVFITIQVYHRYRLQMKRRTLFYLGLTSVRMKKIAFAHQLIVLSVPILLGVALGALLSWPVTYMMFSKPPAHVLVWLLTPLAFMGLGFVVISRKKYAI